MSEAKPRVNSEGQRELDKVEKQFKDFDNQIKDLTLDRMNTAPKLEEEQQTKLSSREIENSKEIYLKARRTISCKERFNEEFRESYNYDKEYVNFIAENKEIIGDSIDMWTRPYPGMAAEFWEVPVNVPIWGPRYLAEQIKKSRYHRLVMKNTPTGADGHGTYYGTMVADTTVQRLDAHPVTKGRRSSFSGSRNF